MNAYPFEAPRPINGTESSDNPYRALRYLVVEDHEASRQTLRLCIQTLGGYSIDGAQSHGDAMYRIKHRMPDVIICDYILGSGRTGQQLLEELRRGNRLPERAVFIMVTAERAYEKVISAVELVPDDYIIKPFAPDLLRVRLEKVLQKKRAFRKYHECREQSLFDAAIEELEAMLGDPANAIYRYEILRSRAVTLAQIGRIADAAATYESILVEHPFPWAKAGLARMHNITQRYDEARTIIEEVIEQVPSYFEAYDLKSEICAHQGDFGEAQAVLAEAARRTPNNYVRKKSLSVAAARNGDFELAREVMDEVVENDIFGDHTTAYIDLARSALDAGREDMAKVLLESAVPSRAGELDDESRLCLECMTAVLEGDEGRARFDRSRAEITRQKHFTVKQAIDITRAALHFDDVQLANLIAETTLLGNDAREAFEELLTIYRQRGLEQPFRDLQREIATRRMARPKRN